VHDPTVIAFGGRYFCFSTSGDGFGVLRSSENLKDWTVHGPILPDSPEWLRSRYRHRSIWAPDVLVLGNRLRVYYCASDWGTNKSVIGVAENVRFNPDKPLEGWKDLGLVIESRPGQETYNAIDPETIVDESGRQWLFFGSYFAGIYVVELDPTTGRLKNPDRPEPILVARNTIERGNPLEGAAVCRRDGYYYLFVSYGLAAQGVRSTYRIMVGRSKTPTGPFLDAAGKSMADGGFVNVMKGSPPMFSPGHCDVLQDPSGRWLMPYHFYDGRRIWHGDQWGLPTLQIRELLWSADGWPLPGLPVEAEKPSPARTPAGKWLRQIDFGGISELELKPGGAAVQGEAKGKWRLDGNTLTLTWAGVTDEAYVMAYGRNYFVRRNDLGQVVRAMRISSRRR
jgi:arabinan endo-1,5-alpha-L-arabinosidase